MYRQLSHFSERNGHVCLPPEPKLAGLKDWLVRQILNQRLLSESQYQRLNRLGVDWDTPISKDHRWRQMYLKLKDFHNAFGHCRVPQKWEQDKQLALWVTNQRKMRTKDKLREDRLRLLSALGFMWCVKSEYDAQWEAHFQELLFFQQAHGHCKVPGNHQSLGKWVERQRISKKKNRLSAERKKRLDKLNFIWSFDTIKSKTWDKRYAQLQAFQQKNGHSFVPINFSENKKLGNWVASQRGLEANGRLEPIKKKKLDELGFVWSRDTQRQIHAIYDAQWEVNFEKLKAYSRAHGTCQVSLKTAPALQRWTSLQRQYFHQGRLPADRIDKLNTIMFPWSVQDSYWMQMYRALAAFYKEFGHSSVPSRWHATPTLAAWVYRIKLNRKQLTSRQVKLLNDIHFDWTLIKKNAIPWTAMYERLLAFRKEHGHTRVPVKWPEDPKLGKWVSRMRSDKDKLAPARIALLDEIAFDLGRRL
nr:helicase associated domain-containing protein [Pontibacter sp. E15-1]